MTRQTNMNEAQMQQRIEELEGKLAHYENNCTVVWMTEDLEWVCQRYNYNRPSKEEARDFLAYIERKHDAEIGITWTTFEIYVDLFCDGREGWPIQMPEDYYEELEGEDWGDHPLNNREVEYNE